MPDTVQTFFATATAKTTENLITAFLRLPEDKRDWSPGGDSRTALDQMAECAILNGSTVALLATKAWPSNGFDDYMATKAALSNDWNAVKTLLEKNTAAAIAAIKEVKSEDLSIEVSMPWGNQTVAEIVAYPYWNMSYHEGQINYIASILGCLE